MKKVVIGLSLLVALCGLAMAGTTAKTKSTKTKSATTETPQTTKKNQGFLNFAERQQSQICTQENYDNGTVSAIDWKDLGCEDYLKQKEDETK